MKSTNGSCPVCMEEAPLTGPWSGCSHAFCSDCWSKRFQILGKNRKSLMDAIACMAPRCGHKGVFDETAFAAALSGDDAERFDAVWSTLPDSCSPQRLSDFGYRYDERGRLCNLKNGEPFCFVSQIHYEALGDLITDHIQGLLKDEYGLQELWLPVGGEGGPQCNIFMSENALEADKLMLLIQGSGAVRPGQWARALCINDSLDLGTICPYLLRATAADYGVIVFNPNMNSVTEKKSPPTPTGGAKMHWLNPARAVRPTGVAKPIPHNSNPWDHTIYVYDQFVARAAASRIAIVAHSAGGPCTVELLRKRGDDLLPKLKAIAFTDSVHSTPRGPPQLTAFLQKHAINYVRSSKPLDTPIAANCGCPCVSAGHPKHEFTSGTAIDSVFRFLANKVDGCDRLCKGEMSHIPKEVSSSKMK